jgi:hypothetical protein
MGSTSSHARKAMKNAAVATRCSRGSADALAHDPEEDMLPVEPLGDPARGACDARVVGARVVVLVENSQKSRPEVPTDATAAVAHGGSV